MIKKRFTFLIFAALFVCVIFTSASATAFANSHRENVPDTQQTTEKQQPPSGNDKKDKKDKKDKRPQMPEGLQHKFARLQKGEPPFLVVLTGTQQKDSPYYKDVRVKIYDKGKKEPIAEIVPSTDSGYSPSIFVGNFDDSGTQKIMLSLQSGGSGAFGYYYIYSFDDGKVTTLFDYETYSQQNKYSAAYRDNYKVEVWCSAKNCAGNKFMIDISRKDTSYLEQLYNADGTLIKPKEAAVSDLNTVMPVYMAQQNIYYIQILQRVTGLYNADLLGYVTTVQSLSKTGFENVYTTLQVLPV